MSSISSSCKNIKPRRTNPSDKKLIKSNPTTNQMKSTNTVKPGNDEIGYIDIGAINLNGGNHSLSSEEDNSCELLSNVDTEKWERGSTTSLCSNKISEIMDSIKLLEKEEEFIPPKIKTKEENINIEDKLNKVMQFLSDSDKSDRLGQLSAEMNKRNETLNNEITNSINEENELRMKKASITASQMSEYLQKQQKENEEKESIINTLRQTLENQKSMYEKQKNDFNLKAIKSMESMRNEDEKKINSHLSFIDKLIEDKKRLTTRCEQLVGQLKSIEDKYTRKITVINENHTLEINKLIQKHEISGKIQQEKWISQNTEKIKELTIKGLEPEIKKLIAKQKQEIKNIKQIHEAELKAADDRASQRYVKLTEDLREQLSLEKEAACSRERELARRSYEKQYEQDMAVPENYKNKLLQQVEEEKNRLESQYKKMKDELDSQRADLMTDHVKTVELLRKEYEKSKTDQQSRHEIEIRCIHEKINVEKEIWSQNFIKQQESKLLECERKLREDARQERDQQIELAIARLEEETRRQIKENKNTEENRLNRMRERYEAIQTEMDMSEKNTMKKYNELKTQYYELGDEYERLKGALNKKDYEIEEREKKLQVFNDEKDRLSEVIRQEFIERLVRTDEQNRRLVNEKTEISTKAKLDIERIRAANEVALKSKDEELQQVHEMVKKAIEKRDDVVNTLKSQYEAALRRADHLEALLLQQKSELTKQ